MQSRFRRIKIALSWGTALALVHFGSRLIPGSSCNDGWQSASIGGRGACSHHGGVSNQGIWWFLLFFGSTIAGFAARACLDAITDLGKSKEALAPPIPPKQHAPTSRPNPPAAPTKRNQKNPRKPERSGVHVPTIPEYGLLYGTPKEYELLLRKIGVAEHQIAIQMAHYGKR
jgi:hypothetical protein